MGLLEAICVVYLRQIIPLEGNAVGDVPALLKTHIEHLREACTMVMLLTTAWLAGFNWRSRIAAFFLLFGVWDIFYYLGLKGLLNWPSSFLEWDCLFLIPVPWFGPVLAPALISCYFILVSTLVFRREARAIGSSWPLAAVGLQAGGWLVWYVSFVRDSTRILARGYEGVSYSWWLFILGMGLALAGVWIAGRSRMPAAAERG